MQAIIPSVLGYCKNKPACLLWRFKDSDGKVNPAYQLHCFSALMINGFTASMIDGLFA